MADESIDLIYLDPPFNSNHNYSAPIGSEAAGAAFKDTWTLNEIALAWHGEIADENPALYKVITATKETHSNSMASYIIYMSIRAIEMHRILKNTGSIYLHCDPTASHYLKLMMDAVFGKRNYLNEITWKRYRGKRSGAVKRFATVTDTILFYQKSSGEFHPQYTELNPDYVKRAYKYDDQDGKGPYRFGGRIRDRKYYLSNSKGVPATNLWDDIDELNGTATEFTGYPTQKPLKLLERVIKASSNEGDLVLDPFCGCATACVSAQDLGRKWIGIDISPKAYELIVMRFDKELGLVGPKIYHSTDIPKREGGPNSPAIKNILYGRQEGNCNGCREHFPYRNMTKDHIIPVSKGGQDNDDNLQLLCGACNSLKGDRDMAFLIARLYKFGILTAK